MAEDSPKSGIGGIGDGIRTGIGILSALREAVEETLETAIKKGEISPDGARQVIREAAEGFQGGVDAARERFSPAPAAEVAELKAEIASLRLRVEALEGRTASAPPPSSIIITE